jgi:broad specificity phosphatase PhoE
MTLPETYTLIRHGFSEANAVQKQLKDSTLSELPEEFFDRHDSNMRLHSLGVVQAIAAGNWLRANGQTFDRFYTSPHTRTQETAYNLHLDGDWRLEDRFRERDYGEVHSVSRELTSPITEASAHSRKMNPWYWKPLGGESLATGVRLRVESMMNSLYRKESLKHVVVVTHGELITTSRFVIERMNPEQWLEQDNDPAYKVQNCMIVQYSRINPNDPTDVRKHFKWRRGICPWDETLSWNGGEWERFDVAKRSDADLKASFEKFKNLF